LEVLNEVSQIALKIDFDPGLHFQTLPTTYDYISDASMTCTAKG
jgi:hypothetical protein